MKEIRCGDIFRGCSGVVRGQDEQEVLSKAADHAKAEHNMTDADLTPDFVGQIRENIHDVG